MKARFAILYALLGALLFHPVHVPRPVHVEAAPVEHVAERHWYDAPTPNLGEAKLSGFLSGATLHLPPSALAQWAHVRVLGAPRAAPFTVTSTTTYTVPAGVQWAAASACGSGGGGGGGGAAAVASTGGGGGGGSQLTTVQGAVTPGDTSFVVTIGASASGGTGGTVGGAAATAGTVGNDTTIVGTSSIPNWTFCAASGGALGATSAVAVNGGAAVRGGGANSLQVSLAVPGYGGGITAGSVVSVGTRSTNANAGGAAGTNSTATGGGGGGGGGNGAGAAGGNGSTTACTGGSNAAANSCAGGGGGGALDNASGTACTGGNSGSGWAQIVWFN